MQKGALILCGGRSSRMRRDKATLPFGNEQLLERVVRLISSVVPLQNIVVVAAPEQTLPSLPANVSIARDAQEYHGPLQGLATGLSAIGSHIDAIYATSCDAPLLVPAFVERMFQWLGNDDAAVPFDGAHYHPLAAVYRPRILRQVQTLLDTNCLRMQSLFESIATRAIWLDDLRDVDPQLDSLKNLNHYAEYLNALSDAGLAPPAESGEQGDPRL